MASRVERGQRGRAGQSARRGRAQRPSRKVGGRAARTQRSTRGRRPEASRERTGSGPSRRRALRRRWVAILTVLIVLGVGYVLLFTPILGVRSVEVAGVTTLSTDRIRSVAAIEQGTPLLRVDTDAVHQRVTTVPAVASAQVSRSWPATIEISIHERTPVAYAQRGGGIVLVDSTGAAFHPMPQPPEGIPQLTMGNVGPDDAATRAATAVLGAIPDALRERVRSVGADTPGSVQLTLADGKVVRWGDAEQSDRKAKVLAALMTQQGSVYDVSSPELPTVS